MNDIQKHLVKLLKEIDEICMQNDIPYILGGRTAKDACQEHQFIGDYVYVTVLMRGQDFDKFCNLVAKKEDRAIESILENSAYPDGMSMRYVDETTSFIYGHTIHNCKHKGIYVNIYKCRNVPKNRYMAKISTALDLGVAAIALEDASILKGKKKTLVEIAHKISKVFGKPFMIKMLLGIQKLLGGSGNKNLALLRYNKKNTLIPRSMFTNVKRVEFEGAEFNVPVDHDNYLQNVYGKKWETDTKPEGIFSPHLLVAATDISYKEIEKDGVLYDNRKEINAAIKKRNSLNAQIKPLRKMITKNWDLLFLTRDRYILYRKYVPLTDTLKDYLAKHEYEELQNVMEEYMDILYLYLSKKLPLFVSDELDQIALELLKVTGDQKDVEKYMKFRADMPMKPINVKPDDADIV